MRPTREGHVGAGRTGLIFKGIGVDPDTTEDPADPVDHAEFGLAYVPFLPPPDTGAPTDLNLDLGTDYDGGGIKTVVNPTNANDGNLVTTASRTSYYNGGGTDTWWLEADLGSALQVDEIIIRGGFGNSGENDPPWEIEHSPDSTTWTAAVGTYTWNGGTNPRTATLVLTASETKRYWRIGQSVAAGFVYSLRVHTWQIIGPQTVTPTVPVWSPAPLTVDGDDSSYEYAFEDAVDATGGPFWRGFLTDSFLINTLTAEVGFEDAGSVTVLVQAGDAEDFSDATTLATITETALGGYSSDSLSASLTAVTGYRYWQLVLDTAAQGVHIYEVNLLEQEAGQTGAELTAHIADPTDAHDASAVSVLDADGWYAADDVEAALAELAAKAIGYQAHGNLGASETFDAAIGQHSGTLDANCTISLTAAPSGTASFLFIELAQNGTGGFTIDLPASVVNAAEVEGDQDTTASETTFLALYSRDGGTTWYGSWWGGGGGGGLEDQGDFTYLDAIEAAAPSTPSSGLVRVYAKTDGRIYSKDDAGNEFGPFDAAGGGGDYAVITSGGTHTTSGGYEYYAFTSSGTLVVGTAGRVEAVVVGGGGGGGGYFAGGGGGAGGVVHEEIVLAAGSHDVIVGAGGAGGSATSSSNIFNAHLTAGSPGEASYLAGLTAHGGGRGGGVANTTGTVPTVHLLHGGSGGGGGGRDSNPGGADVDNQGNDGGTTTTNASAGNGGAGGGGGAGAVGGNGSSTNVGGNGGAGVTPSGFGSFGASGVFGGGGGGGARDGGTGGTGGTGGGGNGGVSSANTGATAGTANTGGGGGGAGHTSTTAGTGQAGGSGVVIVRVPS